MTSEEFVLEFKDLKKQLVKSYMESDSEIINLTAINPKNRIQLQSILDRLLTDAFYTILLGLDGAAQIGQKQELYKLKDELGNEIADGEIETHAWEHFHNSDHK